MEEKINAVFTETENGIDITGNSLNINCITSNQDNFHLDSEGILTVKSIQVQNSDNLNIDFVYPVGSIYMSVNSTNPTNLFGGTWEPIAKGRTLVGVDENDSDFNTVKKIGGSKYMQKHKHTLWFTETSAAIGSPHYHDFGEGLAFGINNERKYNRNTMIDDAGEGESGNLQPYFTCYIWERIA